jgi:CheY-like chemotaxis protein
VLERDTTVQLVLSFPGLVQPVALEAIVRWSRGGKQPGIGVEFLPGPNTEKLTALVERIQQGDPCTVAHVVKVLVVEDNPHVAGLIVSGLGASAKRIFGDSLAFDFATAENGAMALERLKVDTFDAVIIDVYLPVMDGTAVIDRVRHDLGLVDLPIIAVSAGGDLAQAAALAAGANTFLHKPMRLRQVIDTMRQLVKLSA